MSQDRRDLLQQRLDRNYQNYIAQLRKLPFLEVIKLAPEITAAQQICDELAAVCDDGHVEALLALDDPLALLREHWEREISSYDHADEMSHMICILSQRKELFTPSKCAAKGPKKPPFRCKRERQER